MKTFYCVTTVFTTEGACLSSISVERAAVKPSGTYDDYGDREVYNDFFESLAVAKAFQSGLERG